MVMLLTGILLHGMLMDTGKQLQNFIIPTEKKQESGDILNKVHQKGESLTDLITKRATKDGRLLDVLLRVFR